jgi:hypothetical protein
MPLFTLLVLRFFIASTHSNICINLCSNCFVTMVTCILPTRYSPEFSMIIQIKSNYFSINRFVFAGLSLVFCYLRPEFLHTISANFIVAYIAFKREILYMQEATKKILNSRKTFYCLPKNAVSSILLYTKCNY